MIDINKDFKRIKIEKLNQVTNSEYRVYKDYYWVVSPDDEVLFFIKYGSKAPQCNQLESITEQILLKNFPKEYKVKQIETLFVPLRINNNDFDYAV